METDITSLNNKAQILFVDDEQSILSSLKRLTRKLKAQCFFANSGAEGLAIIADNSIDVVVSDMKMPEMSGLEFLTQVASQYPETIRIALTGFTDQEMVMAAINDSRIWGFLQKPWDNDHLLLTLDQALFIRKLMLERMILQRTIRGFEQFSKSRFADFIGDSSAMQVVYHIIETAAPSHASVFITGSSGTGKELAANAIHQYSKRSDGPLIALNCAAIPNELLESEVFGHVKGAFSGAVSHRDGAASLANGGTLFLDELAEMDINLQSKLLRFIQTGSFQKVGSSKTETVDIRFVCATNKNPLKAIEDGLLREDLFYRLNVISLELPDLADREWDSLLLANHFLQNFAKAEDKVFVGFSEDAEQLIHNYAWPGNVRQLENCINSAVIMSPGPLVGVENLNQSLKIPEEDLIKYQAVKQSDKAITSHHSAELSPQSNQPLSCESTEIKPLSLVEREAIEQAVSYCDSNVVKAAALLDVSPSTLYRKIQNWNTAES